MSTKIWETTYHAEYAQMMDAVALFIGAVLGAVAVALFLWMKVVRYLKRDIENINNELAQKQRELDACKIELEKCEERIWKYIEEKRLQGYELQRAAKDAHDHELEVYADSYSIKITKRILSEILASMRVCLENYRKFIASKWEMHVFRDVLANHKNYAFLYKEIIPDAFSLDDIKKSVEQYCSSDDFIKAKAKIQKEHPDPHGYVYVMANNSMPGLLKIGCSKVPFLRSQQLTQGIRFDKGCTTGKENQYEDTQKEDQSASTTEGSLDKLNYHLKTSMPSKFHVIFYKESDKCYEKENIIHYALDKFNIKRGAGTEYFFVSVKNTREVFDIIFPEKGYEYIPTPYENSKKFSMYQHKNENKSR